MDQVLLIDSIDALERLYGAPARASIIKQTDVLHPVYQAFIRAAPFAALATSGPRGLDVSPRGDAPGLVHVEDDKTLLLPDRRGNNRIDSLRNIVADPRVALLFMVPGVGETVRVNGRAEIDVAPALLARFAVAGKQPACVLRIRVEAVFFQCSRAVVRAGLWWPESQPERGSLPSAGQMLAALSPDAFDGAAYDAALPQRVAGTLY